LVQTALLILPNTRLADYLRRMIQNPSRWSFRAQFLFGFMLCAGLIAFAYHTQYRDVNPLDPCPLCIFQRIAFAALAAVFLLGGLHAPRSAAGRRAYGALGLVAAAIGIGIAGRHVWLTHLPADQVPSCGPPLNFMMEANPLTDVIRKVLTGSGECAKVDWTFLGLSMPAWSLVWFIVLALWIAGAAFRRRG
jgi:disulfide bond formation protein DsbB